MKLNSWVAAALLAAAILPGEIRSQETEKPGNPEAATSLGEVAKTEEQEGNWLEFYYQKPDPSLVVSKVKKWAADGSLEQENIVPVIIGFLSQVFRQNRDKIDTWYDQMSGFSKEQKMVIHTAMAFSRTSEADAIMNERIGKAYVEQKDSFPKITEMTLAQPTTLDTLMGYFYATGSETAIRRIIWSFRFEGAPDNPDFADVPEGYRPFYKELPAEAAWRLESLLPNHPRAREICESLYQNTEELAPPERKWLGELLEETKSGKKPEKAAP